MVWKWQILILQALEITLFPISAWSTIQTNNWSSKPGDKHSVDRPIGQSINPSAEIPEYMINNSSVTLALLALTIWLSKQNHKGCVIQKQTFLGKEYSHILLLNSLLRCSHEL